jgi:hypothetical protein
MREWIRSHLTFANVVSLAALFVALGGTAMASVIITSNSQVAQNTISGHAPPTGDHPNLIAGSVGEKDLHRGSVVNGKLAPNSVDGSKVLDGSLGGSDIGNGSLGGAQVGDGSLSSADIQDNGLTGADISEGTLAEVPSAEVGGFGRYGSVSHCDPQYPSFIDCLVLTVNLPTQSRVLLTGSASGGASGDSFGTCKLATQFGDVPNTRVDWDLPDGAQTPGSLVGITGPLGPGPVDFAIDCNQLGGNMGYDDVNLAAVAISPD